MVRRQLDVGVGMDWIESDLQQKGARKMKYGKKRDAKYKAISFCNFCDRICVKLDSLTTGINNIASSLLMQFGEPK